MVYHIFSDFTFTRMSSLLCSTGLSSTTFVFPIIITFPSFLSGILLGTCLYHLSTKGMCHTSSATASGCVLRSYHDTQYPCCHIKQNTPSNMNGRFVVEPTQTTCLRDRLSIILTPDIVKTQGLFLRSEQQFFSLLFHMPPFNQSHDLSLVIPSTPLRKYSCGGLSCNS